MQTKFACYASCQSVHTIVPTINFLINKLLHNFLRSMEKLARVSRRNFLSTSLLPPKTKKNTAGSRDLYGETMLTHTHFSSPSIIHNNLCQTSTLPEQFIKRRQLPMRSLTVHEGHTCYCHSSNSLGLVRSSTDWGPDYRPGIESETKLQLRNCGRPSWRARTLVHALRNASASAAPPSINGQLALCAGIPTEHRSVVV